MSREFRERLLRADLLRSEQVITENLRGWLYIQGNPPRLEDGVRLGTLWLETDTGTLYRCSSIDPVTFTAIGGSGFAAPVDAEYIVAALHAGLTNERLATDTATVIWDFATAGQAKANVPANVVDPANHDIITKHTGFPGGTSDFLRADGTFAAPPAAGITQLTGDVTAGPGSGSQVATIASDAVTNTKLANMAQALLKGRAAGAGTGDPTDLTPAQVLTILSAFSVLNVQNITASGTYTPTAGMKYCLVISIGGGGGGGGADTAGGSGDVGVGGGGASGGTAIEVFSAADIGASQTVTIGAGGTAGSDTGGSGGAGGDTTFGLFHTANGGGAGTGGGISSADSIVVGGSSGGFGSGAPILIVGGAGGSGCGGSADGTIDLTFAVSGIGGSSFWGGGGNAIHLAGNSLTGDFTQAGVAGQAPGSGGSGGAVLNSTIGVTGGVGQQGICVILEFA